MSLGLKGHVSAWQRDWSWAPCEGTTTAGGAQRYPKTLFRLSPTVVTSSLVTPNDAAERPTWVMKYAVSSGPRFMNLIFAVG